MSLWPLQTCRKSSPVDCILSPETDRFSILIKNRLYVYYVFERLQSIRHLSIRTNYSKFTSLDCARIAHHLRCQVQRGEFTPTRYYAMKLGYSIAFAVSLRVCEKSAAEIWKLTLTFYNKNNLIKNFEGLKRV